MPIIRRGGSRGIASLVVGRIGARVLEIVSGVHSSPVAVHVIPVCRAEVIALVDHVLHASLPLDGLVAAQVTVGGGGGFAAVVIRPFRRELHPRGLA